MADAWIRIRENLHEQPEILRIADKLRGDTGPQRPETVVGFCVRFWAWASRNSRDGVFHGISITAVENLLAMPYFLHLLAEVGWLEVHDEQHWSIPKWDEYLSQSSKERALAAKRQAEKRVTEKSRSQRDKSHGESVTKKESKSKSKSKSKRENQENPPISPQGESGWPTDDPIPPSIDNPACHEAMRRWLAYKQESHRHRYKPQGWRSFLTQAAKLGRNLPQAVDEAAGNNFQGIVWTKHQDQTANTPRAGEDLTDFERQFREANGL